MIAQFALRLVCGMSLMWALMPRRQVTSGFFRIQMLVVMGLGVLATLAFTMEVQSAIREVSPRPPDVLPSFVLASLPPSLIAICGFLGSALWTLERRTAGERVGFLILFLTAGLLAMSSWNVGDTVFVHDTFIEEEPLATSEQRDLSPLWRWGKGLGILSEFAGAAVLGGVTVGMLLGHWYLTAPTMSIDPLKRLNQFLGIAGVLRLFVSVTVMVMLSAGMLDTAETTARLAAVPKAWLGLRWLAGVIGPIVVSLMVWRILKYRNTQAATGVLFVGVILAFIGDMTAALLLQETGLPF